MPISGHRKISLIKTISCDRQFFCIDESFYYRPTETHEITGIYKTVLVDYTHETDFSCRTSCDLWEWCSDKNHSIPEGSDEKYNIPACTAFCREDKKSVKFVKV